MPMAAASSTSTTVTEMMTAETGRTSLTAVSALASREEGQAAWRRSSGWQGTGASWGRRFGE